MKKIILVLIIFLLYQNNINALGVDYPGKNLRVLIVGAGISGLTTALGLERIGIIPDLIEIRDKFDEDGAGIALPPNAVWALEKLGLGQELKNNAYHIKRVTFTDQKGDILASEDITKLHNDNAQFYSIHRADLHTLLINHLKKTKIYMGTTIQKIYENKHGIDVIFSNGNRKSYNLIIGADGIHSKVRELLYGSEKLNYQNIMVWRTVVTLPEKLEQPIYMMGENTILLLYPINKSRVYIYAQVIDFKKEKISDHKSKIKKLFKDYQGYVPLALAEIKRDNIYIIPSRIYTVDQIKWGRNNVLLVGDASHVYTPALGQGGAQAIEDAYVLSQELEIGLSKHLSIPAILKNFISRRDPRAQYVLAKSNRKAKILSHAEIQARNASIRKNGAPNISAFRELMKDNP